MIYSVLKSKYSTDTCIVFYNTGILIYAIYSRKLQVLTIYDTDFIDCKVNQVLDIRKAILFIQSNYN